MQFSFYQIPDSDQQRQLKNEILKKRMTFNKKENRSTSIHPNRFGYQSLWLQNLYIERISNKNAIFSPTQPVTRFEREDIDDACPCSETFMLISWLPFVLVFKPSE